MRSNLCCAIGASQFFGTFRIRSVGMQLRSLLRCESSVPVHPSDRSERSASRCDRIVRPVLMMIASPRPTVVAVQCRQSALTGTPDRLRQVILPLVTTIAVAAASRAGDADAADGPRTVETSTAPPPPALGCLRSAAPRRLLTGRGASRAPGRDFSSLPTLHAALPCANAVPAPADHNDM